ncbi:unnamed protein product [Cylindrotheca closterium]|uniref:RING-type domain-containing protein n=1 Tax=Cylindrotheca closterium TaxID=2856 RepID=A0AAD2PY90_9STRA|nr:unnamed protein product [Cylindrotheca closterium]
MSLDFLEAMNTPREETQDSNAQTTSQEGETTALLAASTPLSYGGQIPEGEEENATPATNASEDANNEPSNNTGAEEPRDGAIGGLTRRLRCLFSTITWPIVPLGTIVAMALLWVVYAASSLDLKRTCSHPLHWYALSSLILVVYVPQHSRIRTHLFQYSRERDGPVRPARVRVYDQIFHTICLLYVYTGVTLIQTCNEDLIENELLTEIDEQLKAQFDGPLNTCAATCPNLYQALSIYVATLEMFTFALILPLLFLPCIYLWFLRRATAEAEAFAHLQERMREEENILNNGGITAGEIMDSLEKVKLATVASSNSEPGGTERRVLLLPENETEILNGEPCDIKECCICMNDFKLDETTRVHEVNEGDESQTRVVTHEQEMIRTPCGHLFHTDCLYGWVGGMWQIDPNAQNGENDVDPEVWSEERKQRRARQTCCPLCRKDLRPSVR